MSKIERLKYYMVHPASAVVWLAGAGYMPLISDETYIKMQFKTHLGYALDLEDPRTFNEKLQWLKLHDRNPKYITMVDKVTAKQWVADRIGQEHIIPTLGVWDDPDEIDFNALPDQFVLKCNHNSGRGMCICTDKSKLDIPKVKRELRKGLRENYYLKGREWPYKNVPRKILAEKYMVDESGKELKDYKVFNFDGEPKLIQVDFDRFAGHKRNLYTTDWEYVEAAIEFPTKPEHQIEKPKGLKTMLELSRVLSAGLSHLRTDFYCIDDWVYFGELTLYHGSGCEHFEPASFGIEVGSWLQLPSGGVILLYKNVVLYLRQKQEELLDYKFMCFDGQMRCSFVCNDRFSKTGLKVTFYDRDWNVMPFERHYPRSDTPLPRPSAYAEMVALAERLSAGIPFVRVDFYEVNGVVYFGELTFYPGNGLEEFTPFEWDEKLGSWLTLPTGGYRPDETIFWLCVLEESGAMPASTHSCNTMAA